MSGSEMLLMRLPNDIGGLTPRDPIQLVEHELKPWEKRCHALADVLDFHKIINTEEKRRGVEALGADMVKVFGCRLAVMERLGDGRRRKTAHARTRGLRAVSMGI